MHILRWLMKHPIMLAWLLAIVAILLNFGVGNKQGEHRKEVAAEHNAPAAEATVSAAPQQTAAPVAASAQPAAEQAAVPPTVQPAAEQVATPATTASAQPAAEQAATPATTASAQPAAEQAAVLATPTVASAQPAEQAAAPAAAPAVVDNAAAQQPAAANTPADLLRAAREAYWANELDRAVGLYTDLLKQTPDSLDYKGELANVYWKQGNTQQAATLFTEVAPKLAAQGRTSEALNMKLYVDMVSPDLAKQIDAALKK